MTDKETYKYKLYNIKVSAIDTISKEKIRLEKLLSEGKAGDICPVREKIIDLCKFIVNIKD